MSSDYIVSGLTTPRGNLLENAYVVKLSKDIHKLRRAARAIELAKEKAYPPDGTGEVQYTPDEANILGIFLEQEKIESQSLAVHLLSQRIFKQPKGTEIPIICCPDGGIITADGFRRGIEWYSNYKPSIHSSGKDDSMPDEAVELAAKSGVFVIADSVIDKGNTIKRVIKSFYEKLSHLHLKRDEPITVVVISNTAYLDPKYHNDFDPESVNTPGQNYTLKIANKIAGLKKLEITPPLDLHFYTTDVEEKDKDVAERGSLIAKMAHPSIQEHHIVMLANRSASDSVQRSFLNGV